MTASTTLTPLATFSPDGRHVAVGAPSETAAYVYDAERGGPPVLTVDAHNSLPLPYWRTDGLMVVQGGAGAVTFRVDSELPPFAIPLAPSGEPASPYPTARSNQFFTLDASEGTRSVDADSGAAVDHIPDPGGDPAQFVLPSPDGRFVAVGMPARPPQQNDPITVYKLGREAARRDREGPRGDPPGRSFLEPRQQDAHRDPPRNRRPVAGSPWFARTVCANPSRG